MRGRLEFFVWLVVLALSAGCATRHTLVEGPAIGERAAKEDAALLTRVSVYGDPELAGYLAGVARRVLVAGCTEGACASAADVRITVLADPTLAVFALPGGRLFVHTGLLGVLESEGQLAAILARELARDTSRWSARSFKGPLARTSLSPTGAAALGLDLMLVASAAIAGYGAEDERAADTAAIRWLTAAGYDPREAPRAFEVLGREDPARARSLEIFVHGDRSRMIRRHQALRGLVGEPDVRPATPANAGEFARRLRTVARDNAALDVRVGRFALARRQLDRVLALTPDDAIAELHHGELHRLEAQQAVGAAREESARKALERYERAVALDPGHAETFRQLALLHYQQGEAARARAAFERYLSLTPGAADAPRVREYLAILGTP